MSQISSLAANKYLIGRDLFDSIKFFLSVFCFHFVSMHTVLNEVTIKLLLTDVKAVDLDEGGQSLKTEEVSNNNKTKNFFMFKRKKNNTLTVGSEELQAFIESSNEKVSILNAFSIVEKIVDQV